MQTPQVLAATNAVLVTVSGLLILRGILSIRRGDRDQHMRSMLTATALLTVFLALYVYRYGTYGITPFPGPDRAKGVYFSLLFSHVLLATVSTPLVLAALVYAWRGRFDRHRRIGRIVYPLWLYVAGTGPLVYLMLYHLF